MRRSRARWVGVGIVGFLWLTLPYVLAWGRQGQDWRFTGFLFGVEDGNSYIAKMQLGAAGYWRFTTPYTLEPQQGYWLFGPYLLLGRLVGSWLPLSLRHDALVLGFHLFRLAAAGLLAWSLWRFLGLWLGRDPRFWAWLLALVGGGLGWLPWLWGRLTLPFSWYAPEAFGFLIPLGLPHLALARALLLLWLTQGIKALRAETPAPRGWWLPLLLGWAHGFALAFVLLWGLGLALVARRHRATSIPLQRFLLGSFLAALPWLGYIAWLQRDPFIQAWTRQNILPTPAWPDLAWAYAWVLPWAVRGWRHLAHQRPPEAHFLLWWLFTGLLAAHLPHPLQRRFLEGFWIALSLLVALGASPRPKTLRLLTGIALVGPLLFWLGLILTAWRPAPPAFRPAAQVRAFLALGAHARPGDGVLAAYDTGNALPAWVPVRVPLGLGPESVHFTRWEQRVRTFFSATLDDQQRQRFLRHWDIRFVFYGPAERGLGPWNPHQAAFLQPRYTEGAYAVYEVVR